MLLFLSCSTTSYDEVSLHSSRAAAADDVTLVIDYGNSTQQVLANLSGPTVFDVLNKTTNIAYTAHAFGKFIQSINGVMNNAGGNGYYWQYWVNDQLAPVAADYYVLSNGDDVLWKYCAPGQTTLGLPQATPDWWTGLFVVLAAAGILVAVTALVIRKPR
jgi:hypothetical protein